MSTDVDEEIVIAKNVVSCLGGRKRRGMFKSHLDGSYHKFTPELSMQIRLELAPILLLVFDELTSLIDPVEALARRMPGRSEAAEVKRLRAARPDKPQTSFFVLASARRITRICESNRRVLRWILMAMESVALKRKR